MKRIYGTHDAKRNEYSVFVGNSDVRRPITRYKPRWESKIDHREM
jgi:hypothetical protein